MTISVSSCFNDLVTQSALNMYVKCESFEIVCARVQLLMHSAALLLFLLLYLTRPRTLCCERITQLPASNSFLSAVLIGIRIACCFSICSSRFSNKRVLCVVDVCFRQMDQG